MGLKDWLAWQKYEITPGYPTQEQIDALNCSDETKAMIRFDVEQNRPGGVPSELSNWTYAFDGLYYNEATNTYSNVPGK